MEFLIRSACAADAAPLAEIYAPYVAETTVSFEYEAPTAAEFKRRIAQTLEKYPYLVAEAAGKPIGYTYAGAFKPRAAYAWAVEASVYVRQGFEGNGVGRALYTALEHALRARHILNMNACITYPNTQSIAFHEAMGFQTVAHFHACGYKFGAWHDMIWMEKHLGAHEGSPLPPIFKA